MSAAHSTPTTTAPNAKNAGLGVGLTILALIVCVALVKWIFFSGSDNTDTSSKDSPISVNVTQVRYAPPHDPIKVNISGTLSEEIDIPVDYYLSFICNHDYVIVDGEGNIHNGKANKDVDLGILKLSDSKKNLTLRFKTADNAKTKMKVELIPMQIKN